MRVAIHSTTEIGNRAGRILLAERSLVSLGLVDASPRNRDEKVERADDLGEYDVAVTDAKDMAFIDRASSAGIACVLWHDIEDTRWFADAPLLVGSNFGNGIAPSLAAHAHAVAEGELTIAWTVDGRPLRRGFPVAFPDPVGSLWGEQTDSERGARRITAPVQGNWAGALVMVGPHDNPTRTVGVADEAAHLEAVALAAGVVTTARGSYASGVVRPDDSPEQYLLAALDMGLEVAGFVGEATSPT